MCECFTFCRYSGGVYGGAGGGGPDWLTALQLVFLFIALFYNLYLLYKYCAEAACCELRKF